ncbi:hypothetical protein Ae168Ps1_4893 [Pseudonocardia sp. Ae168_Ps1]|nr:hypothetical protein Ae150APs1_4854 [Pseudonocardia sp. Ae150A_Ps1]OLL82487.1 hypothetical protein Ae168Ps1_4893 [Pseudonocardia sp. Ae168_Ps1]OLL83399.1 hypothetical protein Ae263Ps1_0454c [Pseudonocardia sp. Ae263_Ps1]OLL90562.1 hypothetical protein Ae356Ps1_0459 [Pseudonocardia sp. Ae356_Ps1]
MELSIATTSARRAEGLDVPPLVIAVVPSPPGRAGAPGHVRGALNPGTSCRFAPAHRTAGPGGRSSPAPGDPPGAVGPGRTLALHG